MQQYTTLKRHLLLCLASFFTAVFLFLGNTSIAQDGLTAKQRQTLQRIYNQTSKPEISFQKFAELNAHMFTSGYRTDDAAEPLAVSDYCNKVRPYCTNGDFESGLDQNQYVGAYGTSGASTVYPNPFSGVTYGFSSGVLSSSAARQTIVDNTSVDPIVGIPRVPASGGTRALRLGNSATGAGYEIIAKTLVVDANETILNFFYAVVFEDPGHNFQDQPAFSVRVYDCATSAELTNVCNLGNGSNVVVSDASNPFFQSANSGNIAYRNWSQAQINLSAHIGKTVTIIFTNKDCALSGHYGYTYLDNLFSSQCPVVTDPTTGQGDVSLNAAGTSSCGVGQVCVKYRLPFVGQSTGTASIALNIYQNNALVTTLNSGTLNTYSSDSNYCFSINPATLGINTSLGGFDYTITGTFVLSGQTEVKTVGNPPTGVTAGTNNDYSVQCGGPVYYSKATGDLHNVLTWGLNPDGSGANPSDFNDSTFQLANRGSGLYTMTADWTVNGGTVNIPSGGQLQISGFTFSISQLAGTGTISGSMASNVTVIGTNGGNIGLSFTPASNTLNNFTVNRSGASSTATLGNALNVLNVLSLTSGQLNTGGFLTLKSSATNTARVAPVSSTINGDVTVERYIPARRAWRILSAPVAGSQTINAGWQEGAILGASATPNPVPGFGTHITGGPTFGATANGFDQNPGAESSIKRYNSVANTWQPLQNTNATAVGAEAYMTFIRGDRGIPISTPSVPPTTTTLRSRGGLKVGDQTFTVNPTGFTAIGNPYASPINFATITRSGVQNNFYLWDPKMGGANGVGAYVLLSDNGAGGYSIVPAPISAESQYIQSGQGFLVRPTVAGTAGSITIKESDKSATAATDVFRMAGASPAANGEPAIADPQTEQGLRIGLQTAGAGNGVVLDEVFAAYRSSYSNRLDDYDAIKMDNVEENLGMVNGAQTLMLERRQLPQVNDAIELKLWNTRPQAYVLYLNAIDLAGTNLQAMLEDRYLKTFSPIRLDGKSQIGFTVTADAASAGARFRIVFARKGADAITAVPAGISAYPNPLQGDVINLTFSDKPKGTYQVALMNSAGQVVFRKAVQHSGGTATQPLALGQKPLKGIYRLQVVGAGETKALAITCQ